MTVSTEIRLLATGEPTMARLITILVLLGGGLLVALSGSIALWDLRSTTQYHLVPAGATDVQYIQLSSTQQRVVYQLPPGWTLLDVRRYLSDGGWLRNTFVGHTRPRDGVDGDGSRTIFTQRRWFGRMEFIAILGYVPGNRRRVEVLLSSCLRLERQGGCWQTGRGGPLAQ
jgi:hypothetical protein